jgi:hypothetical protein
MNTIDIYTANNEVEATIVKGLIKSAGIKAVVSISPTAIARRGSTASTPFSVYVLESQAPEAKTIVDQYKNGNFKIAE